MSNAVRPFTLHVAQTDLDDLAARLARTRWPAPETVGDWSQGAPLSAVQSLCEHWRDAYDWRRCERELNRFGQFRSTFGDIDIHFIHRRSPHNSALPLLLTHGWPGSVVEFLKVIDPLCNPTRYGGQEEDAFHIIVPSLPGFGFSDKPRTTGWDVRRIAETWIELVRRLGYDHFVAQGGDWGSAVATTIGALEPPELRGIHLNMVVAHPPSDGHEPLSEAETAALTKFAEHQKYDSAYMKQQATRPQTLGYGLVDSPVAQAAWIYEKFREWTDCGGVPEAVLSQDEMLDNIMLYWLTGSGVSSARLYWENFRSKRLLDVNVPTACSIFPGEILRPARRWAESHLRNIVYWNEVESGGHFAAFEKPELFVTELRRSLRLMR